MSQMIVLGFDTEAEADAFGVKLEQMQKEMILQLDDAAEVVRDANGKPKVKHGHTWSGRTPWAARSGACCSACSSSSVPRLAIGAGLGALFGKGATSASTRRSWRRSTTPSSRASPAGLVIEQITEDKFMAAIEGTNATLVRSNLTEEQEKELKHAFGAKHHKKERRLIGGRSRSGVSDGGREAGRASRPPSVPPRDQRRPRGAPAGADEGVEMADENNQAKATHRKERLEAFSDGVFAIAITLLVLDIVVPAITRSGRQGARRDRRGVPHDPRLLRRLHDHRRRRWSPAQRSWQCSTSASTAPSCASTSSCCSSARSCRSRRVSWASTPAIGPASAWRSCSSASSCSCRWKSCRTYSPSTPRPAQGSLRQRCGGRGEGGVAAQVPARPEPHLLCRGGRPRVPVAAPRNQSVPAHRRLPGDPAP